MKLQYPYITQLGEYLEKVTKEKKLTLDGKDTIDYDKLLYEIYQFAKKTERKDGKPAKDKATAFKIACERTIKKIDEENS